ncbi:hypothetical protein DFH27DRAFT_521865 [Peziza echinospora]|nr:hypothetical protein DFH27DRAFT_521865 [Peziza echinospora]
MAARCGGRGVAIWLLLIIGRTTQQLIALPGSSGGNPAPPVQIRRPSLRKVLRVRGVEAEYKDAPETRPLRWKRKFLNRSALEKHHWTHGTRVRQQSVLFLWVSLGKQQPSLKTFRHRIWRLVIRDTSLGPLNLHTSLRNAGEPHMRFMRAIGRSNQPGCICGSRELRRSKTGSEDPLLTIWLVSRHVSSGNRGLICERTKEWDILPSSAMAQAWVCAVATAVPVCASTRYICTKHGAPSLRCTRYFTSRSALKPATAPLLQRLPITSPQGTPVDPRETRDSITPPSSSRSSSTRHRD